MICKKWDPVLFYLPPVSYTPLLSFWGLKLSQSSPFSKSTHCEYCETVEKKREPNIFLGLVVGKFSWPDGVQYMTRQRLWGNEAISSSLPWKCREGEVKTPANIIRLFSSCVKSALSSLSVFSDTFLWIWIMNNGAWGEREVARADPDPPLNPYTRSPSSIDNVKMIKAFEESMFQPARTRQWNSLCDFFFPVVSVHEPWLLESLPPRSIHAWDWESLQSCTFKAEFSESDVFILWKHVRYISVICRDHKSTLHSALWCKQQKKNSFCSTIVWL